MSKPIINIRKLQRQDLSEVVDIVVRTFRTDEMITHLYPGIIVDPPPFRREILRQLRGNLAQAKFALFIAETAATEAGSPQLVGFVGWRIPGVTDDADAFLRVWSSVEIELLELEEVWARCFDFRHADVRALLHFRANMKTALACIPQSTMMELSHLAIAPEWQRHGIGRRFVDWGLKVADEKRLPVIVKSSPIAQVFYEKQGFEVIKWVNIDQSGSKIRPILLRRPILS